MTCCGSPQQKLFHRTQKLWPLDGHFITHSYIFIFNYGVKRHIEGGRWVGCLHHHWIPVIDSKDLEEEVLKMQGDWVSWKPFWHVVNVWINLLSIFVLPMSSLKNVHKLRARQTRQAHWLRKDPDLDHQVGVKEHPLSLAFVSCLVCLALNLCFFICI